MSEFNEFIQKFISGGLDREERERLNPRILERIQAINTYCIVALTFISIAIFHLLIMRPGYFNVLTTANSIFDVAFCIFLLLYMRRTGNIRVGGTLIILFQYLLFIVGLTGIDQEGFLFIFISVIPYLVVYLKGAIDGLKWLIPFALFFITVIVTVEHGILKTDLSTEVMSYLFFGFTNLSIFSVVSVRRIEKTTETIEKQIAEITTMSRIDYLTSVYNKRTFLELMESERKRTLRHNSWIGKRTAGDCGPDHKESEKYYREAVDDIKNYFKTFSVLVLDIDHFKDINEKYDHILGDEILRAIGNELLSKKILRENDSVGRFGGEEFIVLLPETNSKQAYLVSERLRERISAMKFSYRKETGVSLTVSIGIAEMLLSDKGIEEIIIRADRAMYSAKDAGRNCTKIYDYTN